jgi:peptidoglycan/LPS O-acetylase OafA/YrhL
MGCKLLRRFWIVLVALVASVAGLLLTSGAAFAANTAPAVEETTTPLATGVLIIGVAVLIVIAVVGNRKTLARRTRRVVRRLARRVSRS